MHSWRITPTPGEQQIAAPESKLAVAAGVACCSTFQQPVKIPPPQTATASGETAATGILKRPTVQMKGTRELALKAYLTPLLCLLDEWGYAGFSPHRGARGLHEGFADLLHMDRHLADRFPDGFRQNPAIREVFGGALALAVIAVFRQLLSQGVQSVFYRLVEGQDFGGGRSAFSTPSAADYPDLSSDDAVDVRLRRCTLAVEIGGLSGEGCPQLLLQIVFFGCVKPGRMGKLPGFESNERSGVTGEQHAVSGGGTHASD